MELHLHLTVAFRALDRKWGKPIDLDTPEDLSTGVPAVVDRPTTTFSSEEYLASIRRSKPYSRHEEEGSKVMDTFADISCARIPSLSELEELSSDRGGFNSGTTGISVDLDRSIEEHFGDDQKKFEGISTVALDSGSGRSTDHSVERSKNHNVFRLFKDSAKSYVDKKCKRIFLNM